MSVQSVFTSDGIAPTRTDLTPRQLRKYSKAMQEIDKHKNTRVVCPFCGHMSMKNKFMSITKGFIVSNMFECPKCHERMRQGTLDVFAQGPKAYSEWVWSQFYEFDNRGRLNLENIKKLVKDFDFSETFWDTWKQYKEEYTTKFEDDH